MKSSTIVMITQADDEEDFKEAKKASTSTRSQRRTKLAPIEQVEEDVLRLMEIENKFRGLGTEMLRTANELRDWREEKYGCE
jgi:hypothetical protein